MAALKPAQRAKQKEALAKFHADPNKPTSAGIPRVSKAMANVSRTISDLTAPAAEIVRKALIGGLVPEMEVWEGSEAEKIGVLERNRSARFEVVEVEAEVLDKDGDLVSPALMVEVLIKYVPVSKNKVEIAKWLISQDILLKKAIDDARLRKIATAMNKKKAEDEGALPKGDPVAEAKELAKSGSHISIAEQIRAPNPEWDDEEEFVYEDDEDEDDGS